MFACSDNFFCSFSFVLCCAIYALRQAVSGKGNRKKKNKKPFAPVTQQVASGQGAW